MRPRIAIRGSVGWLVHPSERRTYSAASMSLEASNPEASAKNGELVLCNINMDSSGGDF